MNLKKKLPRTLRQWLLSIFVVLLLVVVVVAWLLMRVTPSWYVPLDPTSQRVIDLMERAQNNLDIRLGANLHNALGKVPLGEQSWSISQDEVNALLALHREMGGELPISNPLVRFTPGKITLAARHKDIPSGHSEGGVCSVVFTVLHTPAKSPSEPPVNVVKIHRAWLGRLPIPKSIVERWLASITPEIVAAVEQQIQLQAGASSQIKGVESLITDLLSGQPLPAIEQHRIIIKAIHVEDGMLTIVFVSPKPSTPATVPLRSRRSSSFPAGR